MTWLEDCARFAAAHGLDGDAVEPLRAFASPDPRGGPPPPPEPHSRGDFEALERHTAGLDVSALAVALCDDVDPAQAALFARRVAAVDRLLARASDPEGRLLRVGLRIRLEGMRGATGARALRVRALADFYYSLGVALAHRAAHGDGLPSLAAAAPTWTPLAPGLRLARVDGLFREGPQHIHVLSVAPDVRIDAADLRSEPGDLADAVRRRGAKAGTSGGFFLYSEPDIAAPSARFDPVGLLVADERVRSPPTLRRAALLIGSRAAIRRVGPEGASVRIGGRAGVLDRAWNRADGVEGPDRPSVAIVGDRVVAAGARLPIPLNGVVVAWPGAAVGDRVVWTLPDDPDVGPIRAAMAGGPLLPVAGEPPDLLAEDFYGTAPPRTFSQDETGDRNLLPRLAVGLQPDGTALFAAVDGRHPTRALGLTLRGTGRLLGALGCTRVLNLDGGSSKRMVVGDRAVDLASTEVQGAGVEARMRPVHTALIIGAR